MQSMDGISALIANGAEEDAVSSTAKTQFGIFNKSIDGDDGSFGPQYGSKFDLTMLFEHSILTIVPIALLIIVCPLYVFFRKRRPIEADRDGLFWSKLGAASVLFLFQTVQLVLWSTTVVDIPKQDWAIAASAVSSFGALCIALMLNSEHRRSIQPSSLLSIYFFIGVITNGIRAGTYISRNVQLETIGGLQVALTVVNFLLLILEEVPKTASLKGTRHPKSLGKEAISGFWTRALFIWLNDLFVTGFRTIIKVKDLSNLAPEFSTERLVEGFNKIWVKADKTKDHSLLRALCQQHGGSFLLVVPPRVGFAIASFSQPFIIYHAVNIVNRKDVSIAEKHAMVVATTAAYAGIAIFRALHTHFTNRVVAFINGTLLGKICGKTLTLPAKKASDGAALTHITADLDTIAMGISRFHDFWIAFFEVGFAMFFLYIYVQYSCFLLFIPACTSTFSAWYLGPKLGDARKVWTEKIEERVGQTTSILAQALAVKATGLSTTVTEYILGLRAKEVKSSRRYRWIESLLISISFLCESFGPVIVIAGAVFLTRIPLPLEAGRIFATIALLNLATTPIESILRAYTHMRDTMSCLNRMGSYIMEKEQDDKRIKTCLGSNGNPEKAFDDEDKVASAFETIDVSLSPPGRTKPAVEHVRVTVPHGKLTIATGQTGSGKTTFLKALIGEADIVDGQVCVEDVPIAYCDQKPWLRNNTIKENIVGSHSHQTDEIWYRDVLAYTCLNGDLRQLADGDQTAIGTKGSKLSGGQRQRVALARALHSRSPVMIFDDIFSALDRPTARQIFFNLFSRNGILRRLNTTVILATHSVEFLAAADVVLHFDGEGKVVSKAGQSQLLDEDRNSLATLDSDVSAENEPVAEVNVVSDHAEEDDQKLEDLRHKGDWSVWVFFFKSAPAWMFSLFIFFSIVQAVAERVTTIFMRIWVDHYANSRWFFTAYAVVGLAPIVGYLGLAVVFWHGIVPHYATDMHKQLVTSILGASLVFLTSTDHAILINRISQDMTMITQRFASVFFQIPYLIVVIATDIALIVSASFYTIILIPFICAIFYVVQLVYLRTSRQIRMLDLEAKTPLYKQLSEIGAGVEHIRAFHWEKEFLQQSYDMIDASQRPFYYMSCIQRWLGLVLDLINLAVALVLMCFALYWSDTTSDSGIGLGFIGLLTLSWNFNHFMELFAAMESSLAAVARLRSFVNDTPQEDDPQGVELGNIWPINGKILFENVSASYTKRDGKEDVLRDVSFLISSKEKAGFVGRTGSGKSSIFLTLLGFLPYRGSIKIDGIEVSRIPRQVLRQRLTAIPQEGLILPGTIRQNLMPWLLNSPNPITAEQISVTIVEQVLQDTFVAEKVEAAGGLDIAMDKLGLSAGEKQLFSMARSVLVNQWNGSKVILLDEATSNLDFDTDKKLQFSISKAFERFTMCTIAHRTKTVEKSDTIYEIDGGRLVSQKSWS